MSYGLGNAVVLNAADASVNQTSSPLTVRSADVVSVQVVMTGTATGSLSLQASNDDGTSASGASLSTPVISNWTSLSGSFTGGSLPATVSSSGTLLVNIPSPGFRWLRVVYTVTSGTGTITATVNAKGIR